MLIFILPAMSFFVPVTDMKRVIEVSTGYTAVLSQLNIGKLPETLRNLLYPSEFRQVLGALLWSYGGFDRIVEFMYAFWIS